MTDFANALLERRIIKQSRTCVVVREVWDSDHPDCPFVQPRWSRELAMEHHLTPEAAKAKFGGDWREKSRP